MRPEKLPWQQRLRSNLLNAPPFLLGTIFFGSLSLLASTWDKPGYLQHRLARRWAKTSIKASGARLRVLGLENLNGLQDIPAMSSSPVQEALNEPAEGARLQAKCAVYASNHTSYMDTPVVFASLPFQFRILAKKELWTLPFIGWYLNRSGQLPIDTENPRSTLSSLGNAVKTLRQGLSVFVFPEGGRTPDGQLQPFLNGAAYLAIRAQVPLVPVALVGVYHLLPIHTRHFYHSPKPHRAEVKLVIGKPIPTSHLTIRNAEALTNQLRETIADLIQQNS